MTTPQLLKDVSDKKHSSEHRYNLVLNDINTKNHQRNDLQFTPKSRKTDIRLAMRIKLVKKNKYKFGGHYPKNILPSSYYGKRELKYIGLLHQKETPN